MPRSLESLRLSGAKRNRARSSGARSGADRPRPPTGIGKCARKSGTARRTKLPLFGKLSCCVGLPAPPRAV